MQTRSAFAADQPLMRQVSFVYYYNLTVLRAWSAEERQRDSPLNPSQPAKPLVRAVLPTPKPRERAQLHAVLAKASKASDSCPSRHLWSSQICTKSAATSNTRLRQKRLHTRRDPPRSKRRRIHICCLMDDDPWGFTLTTHTRSRFKRSISVCGCGRPVSNEAGLALICLWYYELWGRERFDPRSPS